MKIRHVTGGDIMPDHPIEEFLTDLRRTRGRIRADLSKIPVSAPVLALLDEVDIILGRTERDLGSLNDVLRATLGSPLEIAEPIGGPVAWLRAWGRKGPPWPRPLQRIVPPR